MSRFLSFKSFVYYLLAALLCVFVIIFIFSYSVIKDIDLDKISSGAPPREMARDEGDSIDQGVFLKGELLSLYYTWSDSSKSFDLLVEENFREGVIEKRRGGFFFLKGLSLPELKRNDCETVYCLQSRLRFDEIPSLLWRGLIGIEDYRFLKHPGIDFRSLLRAVWHDLKVMKLEQGGSTLTQQLVKNLFYTNEKKFSRKFKEMVASAYIESKLEKEKILQAYFNEVVWGSFQGIKIKGVAAASLFYFKKKPLELTPFEVSILIGLLKGPYFYSPLTHLDRLKERASLVFNKLKELNLFAQKADEWKEKQWEGWSGYIQALSRKTSLRSLFILSEKERSKQTFSNYVLLDEIESLNKELKEKYKKSDFAIKLIKFTITPEVINQSFSHYSKFERSLKKSINNEFHQVGSTLKPIIYGLLSTQGLKLSDMVKTGPIQLKLLSGNWSPREAHKGLPEEVTFRDALIQSLNRPVVRAVNNFGFEQFEKILTERVPRLKTPLGEYPAQLLGSVELSLSELGKVYGEFLRNACWKGMGFEVLEALSDPRVTTIRYRVGEKLGQMKFFGKTGTSNNGYDNWFVGFDGRELLVTWVGLEGNRANNKEFKLYGSNTAFMIYKNYYERRGKLFNEMACQVP